MDVISWGLTVTSIIHGDLHAPLGPSVVVSVPLVPGIQLTGVPHTFIELKKNLVHTLPHAGIASTAGEVWGLCVISSRDGGSDLPCVYTHSFLCLVATSGFSFSLCERP